MKLIAAVIIISIFLFSNSNAQNSGLSLKENHPNAKQELKEKIFNLSSDSNKVSVNTNSVKSKKSPGLAILFSLIIPGAGHFYINRFDVGKYFFGADVASWIGYAALNVYGDDVQTSARTYSQVHAEIADLNDKDDNYFANIGSFNNIYEYNADLLLRGEYKSLYNVNEYYWNWDNAENRNIYEQQRLSSERIYNSRIIFGSLLVVNRIVASISAYLLTKKENKSTTSMNIMPELMYKKDYSFDGVKINLSKNF